MFFNTTIDAIKDLEKKPQECIGLFPVPDELYILIIHLHIGSQTSKKVHCSPGTPYSHNHEYTQLLQTLFNTPEAQFSPEFISSLPQFSGKDIYIHNVVILFDPQYKASPELEGFKIEQPNGKPISSETINHNETIIHHQNDTFTTLKSSLKIIQVSDNVEQKHIDYIIELINNFSGVLKIPNLFNIIDCSSNTLIEFYALVSNGNSNIHMTRPDCAHKDRAIIANPIITIDNREKLTPFEIINSVRWLNRDDRNCIIDLKIVKDVCESSKKSFEFLTQMYKHTIALEILMCILKLLGRFSYTNSQGIYRNDDDAKKNKPIISVIFNNITLSEFINYWTGIKEFRQFIFDNSDREYQYHIMIYINGFVRTYNSKKDVFTLKEALQFEAFEIFRTLLDYCSEDAPYIIKNIKNIEDREGYKLLERKDIADYFKFNDIYF